MAIHPKGTAHPAFNAYERGWDDAYEGRDRRETWSNYHAGYDVGAEARREDSLPTVEMARDRNGCFVWEATLHADTTTEDMERIKDGDKITVRLTDDRILPRSRNRIRDAVVSGKPWRSRFGGIRVKVVPASFGG